jgi:hypothetical protein
MSAKQPNKYAVGDRVSILPDGTALTKHARHRFKQRTPHDRSIGIESAYAQAEEIDHASLVKMKRGTHPQPTRGRVFNPPADWSTVFIVNEVQNVNLNASDMIVTVAPISMYNHAPTRAYLRAHGPHGWHE